MDGTILMVGDFVLNKNTGKYWQVQAILKQKDGSVLISGEKGLLFDYMFEPIELKRVHLTKNGFKPTNELDNEFIYEDGYQVNVEYDTGIEALGIEPTIYLNINFAEKELFKQITYVHELQQAMRFFEIEKTIEL